MNTATDSGTVACVKVAKLCPSNHHHSGLGLDKPGAGTVFKIRDGHPMKDQDWDTKGFGNKTK